MRFLSFFLSVEMVKFIFSGFKSVLVLPLHKLFKNILGSLRSKPKQTYPTTGMMPDPYYRGQVIINKGDYKGYNGQAIGCAVHHVSGEWICLVEFYNGSDVYAIPFEYLEKIEVDRITPEDQ